MSWDLTKIAQILLPDPKDDDPHPRLIVKCSEWSYGVHAGEMFTALFPDGWHEIRLEMRWEVTGPGCWYIASPRELSEVSPLGLFVKV